METKEQIYALQTEEQQMQIKKFAEELENALKFFNPEKPPTITHTTYSRENLRTYLKNPATDSNNKNLRKLSNYLYTVSHVYRRMVNFKAHQINCKVWNAYPIVSMIEEENDDEAILKEYERVVNIVTNMHMETQIFKLMLSAWKTGVAYGFIYGDPENDGSFYIHQLDPDYCKISGASFEGGVLGFLYDMDYFKQNQDLLELWDETFKNLYNESQRDNVRWKQLPIERTICIKIDTDNILYSLPPLSGLFESIISLTDLQSVQDEITDQQNYKMVWGKLDTISGTKSPNDFAVDLQLALKFMEKVNAALPDSVGYALSPLNLDTIEFNGDAASDVNVLSEAYGNLIETNGSIILNSNKITNSTSFKLALKNECDDAMAPMTSINAWLKLYLKYNHNVESIAVEFSDISPYFLDDEIEKQTKLAGLGVPNKLKLMSLIGENPQESFGADYLERKLLGLSTQRWTNPLVSSNTQSSSGGDSTTGGAPEKDELTDEGENTRDKK